MSKVYNKDKAQKLCEYGVISLHESKSVFAVAILQMFVFVIKQ